MLPSTVLSALRACMARRSAPEPTYGHWVQMLPANSDLGPGSPNAVDAANSSTSVVGVQVHYYWHELESTIGVYTLSAIQDLLDELALTSKKLILFLSDRTFNGTTALPAYLSYLDFEYQGANSGWMAARWHPDWVTRYGALINAIHTAFDGHAAFEGTCTEETAMGAVGVTVDGYLYSLSAYRDNWIALFANTLATRPRSWLWWYMNYMNPPGAGETAAFKAVVDAAYTQRIMFGGPNSKMWPDDDPTADYGWQNPVIIRPFANWYQYIYDKSPRPPMFGAWQPADFKTIAMDADWNQPRDLEYNFDRHIMDTATVGPFGDKGAFDWGPGIKSLTWFYQTGGTSPTGWKFSYATHAKPIIEAYPRWWETRPPAFVAKTYYFDGSTYIRTANPSALANTGVFTISFWIKMNGDAAANPSTDGTEYRVLSLQNAGGQGRFVVKRGTSNNLIVQANDSTNTAVVNNVGTSAGTVTKSSGWHLFVMSGDRAQNLLLCYLGNTAYSIAWASTATDIELSTVSQIAIGATNSGGSALKAELSQLWFDDRFIDIRKPKLLETIFSDIGRPLFPGNEGRRYDATDAYAQPRIYVGSPDAASVINAGGSLNRGSMTGTWTKTGNPIVAGSDIS